MAFKHMARAGKEAAGSVMDAFASRWLRQKEIEELDEKKKEEELREEGRKVAERKREKEVGLEFIRGQEEAETGVPPIEVSEFEDEGLVVPEPPEDNVPRPPDEESSMKIVDKPVEKQEAERATKLKERGEKVAAAKAFAALKHRAQYPGAEYTTATEKEREGLLGRESTATETSKTLAEAVTENIMRDVRKQATEAGIKLDDAQTARLEEMVETNVLKRPHEINLIRTEAWKNVQVGEKESAYAKYLGGGKASVKEEVGKHIDDLLAMNKDPNVDTEQKRANTDMAHALREYLTLWVSGGGEDDPENVIDFLASFDPKRKTFDVEHHIKPEAGERAWHFFQLRIGAKRAGAGGGAQGVIALINKAYPGTDPESVAAKKALLKELQANSGGKPDISKPDLTLPDADTLTVPPPPPAKAEDDSLTRGFRE